MPTSAEALQILIFVLPGLLSAKLRDSLSAGRDRSIAELFFDGLLFTLFNWLIAQVVFAAFPALLSVTTMPIEDTGLISTAINQLQIQGGITVLIIAIFTGIVAGVAGNGDWYYRVLSKLRLTQRASSQDVWAQAFDTFRGKWLIVTLEDKSRYRGWARFYSVTEGKPELFLSEAARVNDDGSMTEIKGPGVLLHAGSKIARVEFLD